MTNIQLDCADVRNTKSSTGREKHGNSTERASHSLTVSRRQIQRDHSACIQSSHRKAIASRGNRKTQEGQVRVNG